MHTYDSVQRSNRAIRQECRKDRLDLCFYSCPNCAATEKGNRQSFRVKGKLDAVAVKQLALMPVGEGDFILPLNAQLRKKLGKRKGETLLLQLEEDKSEKIISPDLMECLHDAPEALVNFSKLPRSHQQYYSNWIESAKTPETKAKRIVQALNGLTKGFHYGEMIRDLQGKK